MRASLCWLLAVSLLLPARRTHACPVVEGPPPSAQLGTAQAIVVARLEGQSTEPLSFESGDQALHELMEHFRVVRTLKGSVPQRFRVSTGVVLLGEAFAFTSLEDLRPRLLIVTGEEEGARDGAAPELMVEEIFVEDVEELAVFVDRINEAVQLRERRASKEQEREWLVRCAMRRATRSLGTQALVSERSRTLSGDAQQLTLEQRRAILDGFRSEPTTDGSFNDVLALGRGVPHAAFDRVAVGAMETLLAEPEGELSPFAPPALQLLMERLGVPDSEARWHAALQPEEDLQEEEDYERFRVAAHRRARALWESLRTEGYLVPSPQVPHAWSVATRISLPAD
jgi:hypothetical protein